MLKLQVKVQELFDEKTSEFSYLTFDLELEHSLVSLSKWESQFEKAFLGKQEKTDDETLWYVKAMILTPDVPQIVFDNMEKEHYDEINRYINAKMSATVLRDPPGQAPMRDTITAELIYYWMISMSIPFDPCQNWHLNRLLTLVRVCNLKNKPAKKVSHREAAKQQRDLNAQRRQQFGTRG
jgi:hypothetical protein